MERNPQTEQFSPKASVRQFQLTLISACLSPLGPSFFLLFTLSGLATRLLFLATCQEIDENSIKILIDRPAVIWVPEKLIYPMRHIHGHIYTICIFFALALAVIFGSLANGPRSTDDRLVL